jgi:hypothetical protein
VQQGQPHILHAQPKSLGHDSESVQSTALQPSLPLPFYLEIHVIKKFQQVENRKYYCAL